MTPEQMAEIRERVAKATPGRWYWWMSETPPFTLGAAETPRVNIGVSASSIADAEFVASAKQDIPALLAYIDELEAGLGVREEANGG